MMIDNLRSNFLSILKLTTATYKRSMHTTLDMHDKLIGIIGPRGCGKTTFLLQHLKESKLELAKKLYFSADHVEVAAYSLYEIAKEFSKQGGKLLVIDEIHKYENFEKELKSIYDSFDLQVIFSGCSALRLAHSKADLSRRAVLYTVNGMSFREFCELETKKVLPNYSIQELLENHVEIAFTLTQEFKPYEFWQKYLEYGYYPFYKENLATYSHKLSEIINLVIETDLPYVFNIEPKNSFKLKKLVSMLCSSKPYELNISKLATKIEINRNTLYNYLHYLEAGSIIKTVKSKAKGDGILTKPEKLYLHNTNLSYSYCDAREIGSLREQFFANQVGFLHTLNYPAKGDFLVDNKYTFEIGGSTKTFDQIKDLPNSYLVIDGLEIGSGNKIPLWMFGFLY
jgi:predicted AAA+ superfamily ATPase